jgi:N-acetylmuramic acid 6-phosphate etherase
MDTLELLGKIHEGDRAALESVRAAMPAVARAADAIAERMGAGGRVFYVGAGTSGRLGALDASELPPTFGVDRSLVTALIAGGREAFFEAREGAEDDREAGARDLERAGFDAKDAIVGISASGTTPYVAAALEHARGLGALTVCLVCADGSPLAAGAEFPIVVPTGAEVVSGSTRMKAATAQKLVLTMLSTAIFSKRGLVYRGEMVAMVPGNEKLRRRAERIVRDILGVDAARSRDLLLASDWNLPVALVAGKWGIDAAAARQKLAAASGNVAKALG